VNTNELTATERVVADLPHHCNGCTNRWNGYNTCHCSACHVTFSSIDAFDRHRRGGQCLPPAAVGLVQSGRRYECWGRRDDRQHPFLLVVCAPDGPETLGQYDLAFFSKFSRCRGRRQDVVVTARNEQQWCAIVIGEVVGRRPWNPAALNGPSTHGHE
jgi:hypothetical protein